MVQPGCIGLLQGVDCVWSTTPLQNLLPRMSIVALVTLGAPAAFAACPAPSTSVDVIEAVELAADAYRSADLEGFIETTSKMEALLPCLQEPLPRNVVANVHRMMGLRAFVDRKQEKSESAFGAARVIEPSYRFPETMVPPGHPIMGNYEAFDISQVPVKEVPTPEGGYFQFDGRPTFERPVNLPTVAQLFDGEGAVEVTSYLWPADGMFDYVAGAPATDPGTVIIDTSPKGPNLPLTIGAGGAALTAGVLYGVAASAAGKFNSPNAPYDDGAKLRAQTNTFLLASGGVGVIAVGLGVGAVVAGKW